MKHKMTFRLKPQRYPGSVDKQNVHVLVFFTQNSLHLHDHQDGRRLLCMFQSFVSKKRFDCC